MIQKFALFFFYIFEYWLLEKEREKDGTFLNIPKIRFFKSDKKINKSMKESRTNSGSKK